MNMRPPKIDKSVLIRMLREGKSQKEISEHFGVSRGAVSMSAKNLKNTIIRTAGLEKASQVLEADFDMMAQLRKINRGIDEQLEAARREISGSKCTDRRALQEIIIKLSAEIRKQLETGLRIAEVWFDHKIYGEFQAEVLGVLEEAQPGVRDAIIKRLKEKRALRGLVRID